MKQKILNLNYLLSIGREIVLQLATTEDCWKISIPTDLVLFVYIFMSLRRFKEYKLKDNLFFY